MGGSRENGLRNDDSNGNESGKKSKRFRLAKQLCTCIMSLVEDAENTKTTGELSFAISEL